MPTILRIGPFRFFFYSSDVMEKMHIHVGSGRKEAKFWIEPLELAENEGFSEHELRTIKKHIAEHKDTIENEWNSRKERS